ncbi:hypothetical protein [Prevotella intermedia]|nr:hypothetical protein [Prevotella intermedia]
MSAEVELMIVSVHHPIYPQADTLPDIRIFISDVLFSLCQFNH